VSAHSDRFQYLQALVTEFQDTDSAEAKEQVLANLANFSYDPRNLSELRRLQVADLFLDMLTEDNETLVEFGMGGLCNLCLDKVSKSHILASGALNLVINCLSSHREETVLSAVTALMYLSCAASHADITSAPVVECMVRFSLSNNRRLRNLATIFLEDYCSEQQVREAQDLHTALGIPLPHSTHT
uniref:Armadillo repeat-containing protein 7 n=1 Tax=Leptobrachium leishanense TaxID=445787 RepID=A0A8C5QKR6_9ANUR